MLPLQKRSTIACSLERQDTRVNTTGMSWGFKGPEGGSALLIQGKDVHMTACNLQIFDS